MSNANSNSKQRSPAQIAASRANGAQSKGPKSEEGKTRSSRNRMAHGFRSKFIALSTEDRAAYNQQLDAYLHRYTPIDAVEADLVGLAASNMWSVKRLSSIETALFDFEISGVDVHSIEETYEDMDEHGRLALAFKKSAGDNALETLRRYKSTAERAFHRAYQACEAFLNKRKAGPQQSADDDDAAEAGADDHAEKSGSTVRTQAPLDIHQEPDTNLDDDLDEEDDEIEDDDDDEAMCNEIRVTPQPTRHPTPPKPARNLDPTPNAPNDKQTKPLLVRSATIETKRQPKCIPQLRTGPSSGG